jgi:hypothetical protein
LLLIYLLFIYCLLQYISFHYIFQVQEIIFLHQTKSVAVDVSEGVFLYIGIRSMDLRPRGARAEPYLPGPHFHLLFHDLFQVQEFVLESGGWVDVSKRVFLYIVVSTHPHFHLVFQLVSRPQAPLPWRTTKRSFWRTFGVLCTYPSGSSFFNLYPHISV